MKTTIVGCGDIGVRLARRLLDQGHEVAGWVRSRGSVEAVTGLGIHAHGVDLDRADRPLPGLAGQQVYYLVPPPPAGREDTRVARLLDGMACAGAPRRVVYLSTSGVYGDCRGAWVDEERPPAPRADRAWRRLDAERRWQAWCAACGVELVILRVAGIYGPGKLPVKRLRSGQPMVAEADSPITNHIHSQDLVRVCLAAMQRGRNGEVYNVSDGHPGTMTGYFNQVADALGLPRPPVISLAEAQSRLSPGMRSYLRESRRLNNRKLLGELGVALEYPDLEQGLTASLPEPPLP